MFYIRTGNVLDKDWENNKALNDVNTVYSDVDCVELATAGDFHDHK